MRISSFTAQHYEVLVCGAGSAGCAAAVAASAADARTLLVERLGFCGGTPVTAGIHTLDGVKSCQNSAEMVVGGFAEKFIERTLALGGGSSR